MQNKTRILKLSNCYYTGSTGLLMNLRERLRRFVSFVLIILEKKIVIVIY